MHGETVWFETQRRPEGYRIFGTEEGAYTAYHSLSPDGFSPDNSVAGFARELLAPDLYPGRRSYFHILDEAGGHFVTAPRDLGFESVRNFRELGGYPAADGRRVRWGRFYRSARLGGITPEEKQRFAQLGIRVVLDLRSDGEIAQMPDPVFEGSEQKVISALIQKNKQQVNLDPSVLFTFSPEEMLEDDAAFTERYRQMPFDNEAYHYLFDKLEKGETPVLFHCTAGKDRTGVAAMLILLALGVSWETIKEDYMLTNLFCGDILDEVLDKYYKPGQPEHVRHFLTCIAGVELRNLEAAYESVLARYGDVQRYFSEEFGLQGARMERLRDRYLEEVRPR
ncbi:tyrosine-protein phosphatase [Anaerofilum sp. BX8]|uniref:Tyrosine-protein phosphatase n=1 Tax=Anaerofilum hominis TaxID=2763016 RepID=A0A923I845_9FIRM|nr:tyrosine-protein phosphatase [Anaerofilum hominis]MBC5582033.1 tyrosine-protein phosphatase [Anaerofilum hominis]